MKKMLLIVLAVVMGVGPAFAGPALRAITYRGNYYQDTNANALFIINSSPQIVQPQSAVIYTMTVDAISSNAELDIYDSATGATNGDPVWEVKCATSGDSRTVEMNAAPLNMYNGITAKVTNGVGFISYQ